MKMKFGAWTVLDEVHWALEIGVRLMRFTGMVTRPAETEQFVIAITSPDASGSNMVIIRSLSYGYNDPGLQLSIPAEDTLTDALREALPPKLVFQPGIFLNAWRGDTVRENDIVYQRLNDPTSIVLYQAMYDAMFRNVLSVRVDYDAPTEVSFLFDTRSLE